MPSSPPSPLVDAPSLSAALGRPGLRLLDASFDLVDADAGARAYARSHLPGALYAHLERDLSASHPAAAAAGTAFAGRHPLPTRAAFAATLGRWGITPSTCVVAMDRQGGPYAARLWWMLRWLGHTRVWVLDGGVPAWAAAGGALTDAPTPDIAPVRSYPAARTSAMATVSAVELLRRLGRGNLVDARAPERFRGEVEPLDPVAGHIPGALNRPFKDNLDADGRFKPRSLLDREYGTLLGAAGAGGDVVHYCGSGVTACHNLLAMAAAGRPAGILYPGSWSEWVADPARPMARGG